MKCLICNKILKNNLGLGIHLKKSHNETLEKYTLKYIYNDQIPKCKCGCDKNVTWHQNKCKYNEYINGHHGWSSWNGSEKHKEHVRKINLNRPIEESRKRGIKSAETKRKQGNLNHTQQTKDKISKTLKEEYKKGNRKVWQYTNENAKDILNKLHKKRANTISKKLKNNEYRKGTFFYTKSENKLKYILDKLNIEYIQQYKIKTHPFDFYLPKKNLLIEVDGDYWHCNKKTDKRFVDENFIHPHKKITTKEVRKKDEENNMLAKENNYKIIRLWDSEIKTHDIESMSKILGGD